jgi:hypothetical protein
MTLSHYNSSRDLLDAMKPNLYLALVRTAFFVSRTNFLKTEDDKVAFAVESPTHEIVRSLYF